MQLPDRATLPVLVKNIYFGGMDAGNEIALDEDLFLNNYYDLNSVAEDIKNDATKYVILGKKGTGKTALGKYIELNSKKHGGPVARYVSFEQFDYRSFARLKDLEADSYEQYQYAWKWVLLSFVADTLRADGAIKGLGVGATINRLLEALFGDVPITLSRLTQRRVSSGFQANLSFVGDYINEPEHIPHAFRDVTEALEALIEDLPYPSGPRFLILIDGLDEKIRSDDVYTEALTGLLWTTNRINRQFREADVPVKIVIMLRDDVFELLSGPNINKLYYDNSAHLNWLSNARNKFDWPLASVLNRRINNYLRSQGFGGLGNPLDILLPEKVGHQQAWDWVLQLTTYKPRDVIQFFNLCKKLCTHGEHQLTENVLWEALRDQSKYLVSEFCAEMVGHFHQREIDEIFNGVLTKLDKNFTYAQFVSKTQWGVLQEREPADVLKLLYRLGVIGIIDRKQFTHWVWRSGTAGKDDIPSYSFEVHHGLWKYLCFW